MRGRCLILLLAAALAIGGAQAQSDPLADSPADLPGHSDIRLVVDISGSMKHTDPNNLRRPALSLLVRLLPPGSQAGVWTFGHRANDLIPHRTVDGAWKTDALERMDAINSVALFTHIGAALERAAYDREGRTAESPPVEIVLLTDGMVDISPDATISAREQTRVVEELVPALRRAGYRIHTIGLSNEADEPLLKEIARRSDGVFSRARDADELMDSLLLIFQQAVPAERLPVGSGGLEAGSFLVDDSIREFTALIRREAGQAATELTTPDGHRLMAGTEQPGVNWLHTDRYDLITVRDPMAGRWRFNTELLPFSRVTVTSDLQLVVNPLPNNLLVGESLPLAFHLRDRRGVVDSPELLELLTFTVAMDGPESEHRLGAQKHRSPPDDGRYQTALPAPRQPGDYELQLVLDGKTFQRLFTHRLSVASPFAVTMDKQIEGGRVAWTVTVEGEESVDPSHTSVIARVQRSGGFSVVEPLEQVRPGLWRYRIEPQITDHYRVALEARGQTPQGRSFGEYLPSQYFVYPEPGDPQPDPLQEAIGALQAELQSAQEISGEVRGGNGTPLPGSTLRLDDPMPVQTPVEKTPLREAAGAHPALLLGSVLLANGVLLGLGYLVYRYIMKEPTPQEAEKEADASPQEPDPVMPPLSMQQIDTGMADNVFDETPSEAELELDATPANPEAAAPVGPVTAEDAGETGASSDPGFDDLSEEPLFPIDIDADTDETPFR